MTYVVGGRIFDATPHHVSEILEQGVEFRDVDFPFDPVIYFDLTEDISDYNHTCNKMVQEFGSLSSQKSPCDGQSMGL